jgi:hypothetical protein
MKNYANMKILEHHFTQLDGHWKLTTGNDSA